MTVCGSVRKDRKNQETEIGQQGSDGRRRTHSLAMWLCLFVCSFKRALAIKGGGFTSKACLSCCWVHLAFKDTGIFAFFMNTQN